MEASLKVWIGIIGSLISWIVGGFGMAFAVLIVLMAIDFFTGLFAAYDKGELSATVGIKGFVKKMYIIILVGAVYMVELTVLKSNGVVKDGIIIAYSILEFLSIVENGGKLGVPIGPLKNVISVLKQKGDSDNGKGV